MKIPHSPEEISDRAKGLYLAGDYAGAIQAYSEAEASFSNNGNAAMAAEMKNNLSVALLRDKQAPAALKAASGTEEIFAATGDFRRMGISLANQASALEALKRQKEAIDCYKQAGDAFEKAGEIEFRFEVMQLLSALYLRRFKFIDAIITLQSGLAPVKNPTPKQQFMKKLLFFRL